MLSRCGQHLTALELCEFQQDDEWSLRELPCPNLLELTLTSGSVQLGAADGYPGVVQGCTKLSQLELWWNSLGIPDDAVLDSLSSLVHLQHLVVMVMPRDEFFGLSVTTLPRLEHLTYLQSNSLSTENLLQLSGLTNLQELHLGACESHPWAARNTVVGPSSVPGLVFPASVTSLSLSFFFLNDTRGAHPSPAGHTQLSRVTPTAGGRRLSLTDEGRLTHLITGGAQHLDQTRMGLEPIHPLRVLQHSGHAHATESAVPLKGFRWAGRDSNPDLSDISRTLSPLSYPPVSVVASRSRHTVSSPSRAASVVEKWRCARSLRGAWFLLVLHGPAAAPDCTVTAP